LRNALSKTLQTALSAICIFPIQRRAR